MHLSILISVNGLVAFYASKPLVEREEIRVQEEDQILDEINDIKTAISIGSHIALSICFSRSIRIFAFSPSTLSSRTQKMRIHSFVHWLSGPWAALESTK